MKVLFLAPWPSEAASTRLRATQYFPYLREQGVEPLLRPFMSERFYRVVYRPGALGLKTFHFLLCVARRLGDVARAARADLVVIHREAFPFGTTLVERMIARQGTPVVFDFDDAIYLPSTSPANGLIGWLKRPGKVPELLRLSRAVIAGNRHLAAYSAPHNSNVVVLPTPVDSERFRPRAERPPGGKVVVGWVGSSTTAVYLRQVVEPLRRLLAAHPEVELRLVGGRDPVVESLPARAVEWTLETEVRSLQEFDVGLMPYPDNEWARGKCAHKALLYMSVGIPAVCSPVGMATEFVRDGENGFLASSADEWFDKLARLVESASLRRSIGEQARALVVREFDLKVLAPRLLAVLHATAEGKLASAGLVWSGKA